MFIRETSNNPKACIIWMHGLGADGQDMASLAGELRLNTAVRHVFLNAPIRPVTINNRIPMRAWYDILGVEMQQREDQEGILQSVDAIESVLQQQLKEGFNASQIYLAGFSQGGAMALVTGLRSSTTIGGIIALSAYLPLAELCKPRVEQLQIPVFMANGQFDELVLPGWTKKSIAFLQNLGMTQIVHHEYPMAHAVCLDEIHELSNWLNEQFQCSTTSRGSAS